MHLTSDVDEVLLAKAREPQQRLRQRRRGAGRLPVLRHTQCLVHGGQHPHDHLQLVISHKTLRQIHGLSLSLMHSDDLTVIDLTVIDSLV